jgi:hypothetical protein
MKRVVFVLALLTIALPGLCFAGPFGFDYGMTKDQVIKIVGKDAVIKDQGFVLRVLKAPEADNRFEAYTLLISPDKGLLKIIAAGQTIDSSGYGMEIQVGFKTLREYVAAQYGAPTKDYDFVQPGSQLQSPSDWTAALQKKERVLASTWDLTAQKHLAKGVKDEHLTAIILETMPLKNNEGWIQLTYEFEGFDEFYKSVNKKSAPAPGAPTSSAPKP